MIDTVHSISYDYMCSRHDLFEELCDTSKARKWFPELFVTQPDTQLDLEKLRENGIQYIARINKTIPYSNISGTIESIDNTTDKLHFEWTLTRDPNVKNWTHLNMEFTEPVRVQRSRWWGAPIIGTGGGLIALFESGLLNAQNAYASGTTNAILSKSVSVSPSSKGGSLASASSLKIAGIIAILAVGGIFGSVYANSSNTLLEMENLITLANQQYENKQYEASFDTFSKVDMIFLSTEFSPDHVEHAEYLHLQSLTGMGNSLQSQSNFGQIKSFSEKSEEYYLYALVSYEGKHDTENVWIGRGINAIYETPEKTLEMCSMFDSVNSHMCQGEAYSYLYVIGKAPLEKADEQFEMALDMAGSKSQKLKVINDIENIYNYYKLPEDSKIQLLSLS